VWELRISMRGGSQSDHTASRFRGLGTWKLTMNSLMQSLWRPKRRPECLDTRECIRLHRPSSEVNQRRRTYCHSLIQGTYHRMKGYRMAVSVSESQEFYQRVSRIVPGGVHSNTRARTPHPLYFERGEGAYLIDVDGNAYLDYVCGNGAIILGHGHPAVTEKVQEAVASGITTGSESRFAVEAAELFLELVPTAEMVRFTNTGTEAIMHATEIARAITGRARIAKIEGAYHGWQSEVFVSAWPDLSKVGTISSPNSVVTHRGVDAEQSTRTLVLPFNEVDGTRRLLEANASDLAAVIIEPVLMDIGYIEATQQYIDMLREVTSRLGIVLIFDELLTGFRVAPGGAQEYYGVTPDLSTFGKAIANGYPLAAVAGRRDVLSVTAPGGACAWVGTFNGQAVSMAAAVGSLGFQRSQPVWQELQRKMEYLKGRFQARAEQLGVPVCLSGRGGNFHWYFTDDPVTDYRSATRSDSQLYARFVAEAESRDILLAPGTLSHHSFTMAHSSEDLERFCECLTAHT
jgi:glutamate-1-semialdehyde 2,1-aminomutase